MGLFGKKTPKGISEYELTHDHVESRLNSVFSNTSIGRRKRAALGTAMKQALDKDSDSHKFGVVQREEFEGIVGGLQEGGVISESEANKLRNAAEKPLED